MSTAGRRVLSDRLVVLAVDHARRVALHIFVAGMEVDLDVSIFPGDTIGIAGEDLVAPCKDQWLGRVHVGDTVLIRTSCCQRPGKRDRDGSLFCFRGRKKPQEEQ